MIIVALIAYGLCLGSFVNALVWRIRAQEQGAVDGWRLAKKRKRQSAKGKDVKSQSTNVKSDVANRLSVVSGRSMCPNCHHELAAKDLIPVLSWVQLRGKCRYCRKPISAQYPVVELLTAVLFVASFVYWPKQIAGPEIGIFISWLVLLVGFVALIVYDLRWMILPDRIVYPLTVYALGMAAFQIVTSNHGLLSTLGNLAASVAIGGGIFYVLFQVSGGKWIGGGDVKLGWLLGLVVGTPQLSALFIFLAAFIGSLISVPLLLSKKMKRSTVIPFGPFLIAGAIIAELFGATIIRWYEHTLLGL